MAAITKAQLANLIKEAFDFDSDKEVSPAEARQRQADKIADAVSQFVIGRTTTVTGTSATGGVVTGTGTIKV
jgi:hypothetical protein